MTKSSGFTTRALVLTGGLMLALVALLFALLSTSDSPASAQVDTQAAKPAKPTGLDVETKRGSKVVEVDWNDVAGAGDYLVRWRLRGPGQNLNQGVRPTSSNTQITVADYGDWVVRVEACNNAGCSAGAAKGFTVEAAPAATSTPTATATPTPAPTITAGPTSVDFAENGAGTVATYAATVSGNGSIAWTVEGTDGGKFNISAAGALSFRAAPDYETAGDADGNNQYQVTVKATANGQSATRAVTVTVTGVDEAPTITSGPTAVDFAENGAGTVATYAATDPENDSVAWTVEGTDGGKFNISSAGALSFKAAPDYETAGDADGDNQYQVTVKATANGRSATRAVTVTVTNVDETARVIATEKPAKPTGLSAGVTQGSRDVSVDWNDVAGADDYLVQWRLRGPGQNLNDGVRPTSSSETITVADYGSWVVRVQACNNVGCSAAAAKGFTVEAAPAPTITAGPTAVNYAENRTDAVATYTATASGNGTVAWTVEGADGGKFNISAGGALSFKAAPDYETAGDADEDNQYQVTVKATADGQSATRAVTVTVVGHNLTPSFAGTNPTTPTTEENYGPVITAGTYRVKDPEGDVVTLEVAGDDAARFAVHAPLTSGNTTYFPLVLNATPDFESPDDANEDGVYEVTLRATDADGSGGTAELDVRLTVTNVDEGPPMITDGPAATNYSENRTDAVATYVAMDPDNDSVAWTVEGADGGKFNISAGGALSFKAAPDFETPGDADGNNRYQVTVKATASGQSATRAVTVTVVGYNLPPYFAGANPTTPTTEENYGPVITAGTYRVKDPEGDVVTLEVAGDDAARFAVHAPLTSGNTTYFPLVLNATPDFESPDDANKDGVYEITLRATDANGSGGTAELDVRLAVEDVDETPPVITGLTEVDFPENSLADVGQYAAADPDGTIPTLTLGGTDASSFTFTGGRLMFNAVPDYETDDSYFVTFVASDGTNTVTLDVRVTITDVDETRAIVVSGSETLSIEEDSSNLLLETYTATDPDGGQITWSLWGPDKDPFTLSGGALSLKASPDYETPLDADGNNQYQVTVIAASGSKNTPRNVTVTVTSVDGPPVITAGPTSVDYAEARMDPVATYAATDPDNDSIAWTVEGVDGGKFRITPGGALTFKASPDYETPGDADGDNQYQVTVKATANGKSATRAVTVIVIDAGDNSFPYFPRSGNSTTPTVLENHGPVITAGTYTLAVGPPEGDGITVTLAGADAARFATGSAIALGNAVLFPLHLNATPDFELPDDADKDGVYEVTLRATDADGSGEADELDVNVRVADVADEPPVIRGLTSVSIPENSRTAVGSYSAADLEGATSTLTLGGTDASSFAFTKGLGRDAERRDDIGALTFNAVPDYETRGSYSVTFSASDQTKNTATLPVKIKINNVVEPGEITVSGSETLSIEENSGNLLLETYTAVDPDGGQIAWSLEGADKDAFTLSGGALSLKASPDHETKSSYAATVIATAGSKKAPRYVTVTVPDVDEAPEIAGGPTAVNFTENGTGTVATHRATDPENDWITWSREGVDAGKFNISMFGELSFKSAPDFETPGDADGDNRYQVTVKATGNGRSATRALTVTVNNEAIAPAITGPAEVSFPENSTGAVATYTATDPDTASVASVVWTVEGRRADNFNINAAGALSFKSPPDYETPGGSYIAVWGHHFMEITNTYYLTVKATANGKSSALAVKVKVANVDEAPPVITGPTEVSFREHSLADVGEYTAMDPDWQPTTLTLGGTDASSFTFTSDDGREGLIDGVLKLNAAPDYETKSSYSVTLTASDGTSTTTLNVRVTIIDLPEKMGELRVSSQRNSVDVEVDWDDVSGADYYWVRWQRPGPDQYLRLGVRPRSSEATIRVRDYGEWEVQVEACNRNGCSPAVEKTVTVDAVAFCKRTLTVRAAIMDKIANVSDCSAVTTTQLAAITGALELGNSHLTELRSGDFDGLTSLRSLSLGENQLTELPTGLFDDLTGLGWLRLSNNQLEELPAGLFDNLTNLVWLHLGHNKLTEVPANLLDNKPSLHTLELNDNQLTGIPGGLLDGRTSLRTLNLGGNRITGLPAGTFEDLIGIETLTLEDLANPRLCGSPQAKQRILAQLPDISDCKLVTWADVATALDALPVTPVCDRTPAVRDAIVSAVSGVTACANVTEMHLAGITGTLALNSKGISSLKMGDLDGLTGITGLELQHNRLAWLPLGLFKDLEKVTSVRLDNNRLAALNKLTFHGMDALTTVRLNHNNLRTAPAGLFHGHTKLQEIYLNNNNLTGVTREVRWQPVLRVRDSTGIHADTFAGLTALHTLRLDGNRIDRFPPRIFKDLTGIQTLNLDYEVDSRLCSVYGGLVGLVHPRYLQDKILETLPDIDNCKLVSHVDLAPYAHQYLEGRFIIGDAIYTPRHEEHPWLHEAWFDSPADIEIWRFDPDDLLCPYGRYFATGPTVELYAYYAPMYQIHSWILYDELAHHYTLHPSIHADNPTAKLSILAGWLYYADLDTRVNIPRGRVQRFAEALRDLTRQSHGFLSTPGPESRGWLEEEESRVVDSISAQQIPQWFFDTYTTDGTIGTVNLDRLWRDLRREGRINGNLYQYFHHHLAPLFGGYCSLEEARAAFDDPDRGNPWVDGGCTP